MIDFEEIQAREVNTGDVFKLVIPGEETKAWDCVTPCIIIGHQNGTLVLQDLGGPRVNVQELLPVGSLRTRGKPGQVSIEVLTLGSYEQIVPEELVVKTISLAYCGTDESVFICEDKSYVKLRSEIRYGAQYLVYGDLTMEDLRTLGQLDADTWAIYTEQKTALADARFRAAGEIKLDGAIRALGLQRVKGIVDNKVDAVALV